MFLPLIVVGESSGHSFGGVEHGELLVAVFVAPPATVVGEVTVFFYFEQVIRLAMGGWLDILQRWFLVFPERNALLALLYLYCLLEGGDCSLQLPFLLLQSLQVFNFARNYVLELVLTVQTLALGFLQVLQGQVRQLQLFPLVLAHPQKLIQVVVGLGAPVHSLLTLQAAQLLQQRLLLRPEPLHLLLLRSEGGEELLQPNQDLLLGLGVLDLQFPLEIGKGKGCLAALGVSPGLLDQEVVGLILGVVEESQYLLQFSFVGGVVVDASLLLGLYDVFGELVCGLGLLDLCIVVELLKDNGLHQLLAFLSYPLLLLHLQLL